MIRSASCTSWKDTLMMRKALTLWHPVVLGIYPILRIWVQTVDPVMLTDCLRDILLMVVVTFALLWLLKPVLPELAKRAVVISIFYLVFFNYLLIVLVLSRTQRMATVLGEPLAHPIVALAAIGMLMAVVIYAARRSSSSFRTATTGANIFATALLVFIAVQSVAPAVTGERSRWLAAADGIIAENTGRNISPKGDLPDIYYIILDGYGRSDVLKELYGFDNAEFLAHLVDQGFVVPAESHSNYVQTYLSLASSLNLTYLDKLQKAMDDKATDRRPLRYLIENNSVARLLRQAGYQFVFMPSSYSATSRSPQADVCFCRGYGFEQCREQADLLDALGANASGAQTPT